MPLSGSNVCAKSVNAAPGSGEGLLVPTPAIWGCELPQVLVSTLITAGVLARPVASVTTNCAW